MKNQKINGKHANKSTDRSVNDGFKNNNPSTQEYGGKLRNINSFVQEKREEEKHRGQGYYLDPYVFDCAKYYSLKLVRYGFYSFSDLEDLEQEILIYFIENSRKYRFNKDKSSYKNWVIILVKSAYRILIKKAKIRRKYNSNVSLNDFVKDSDNNSEIIDFIEDNNSNFFEELCQRELNEKLYKTIKTLPEDLKQLCRLLQCKNITEVAKELNLSRKSVYKKIHKIKTIFEKAGLK
jgi:RNA polymerase sigma factor (sigma-70 family)